MSERSGASLHSCSGRAQLGAPWMDAKGRVSSSGKVANDEASGPPGDSSRASEAHCASIGRRTKAFHEALGRAVYERRRELRISRRQLAMRLEQSEAWMLCAEGGNLSPDLVSLVHIARALGLTPAGLLALAEWLED